MFKVSITSMILKYIKCYYCNILSHDLSLTQTCNQLRKVLTSSKLWCEHITHFLNAKNLQDDSA